MARLRREHASSTSHPCPSALLQKLMVCPYDTLWILKIMHTQSREQILDCRSIYPCSRCMYFTS